MFEKEATQYQLEHTTPSLYKVVGTAWQKGAEFGYNKCFEQIKKLVNESTRLDCIIPELLRLQESE